MKITRLGQEWELSRDELYRAWEEYETENNADDILEMIDDRFDILTDDEREMVKRLKNDDKYLKAFARYCRSTILGDDDYCNLSAEIVGACFADVVNDKDLSYYME